MKKIILFILCLVLVSSVCLAAICDDTDDERDYDRKGKVKYGITEEWDRCVMGPNAEVQVETSLYLMEYYCTKDDKRDHEVVDCSRHGFARCYQGACIGGESDTDNQTAQVLQELPKCGDKKLNQPGEECDPPGKICYTESFAAGICNDFCACDVKLKGVVKPKENVTEENVTKENITEPKEEVHVIEPEVPEVKEPEVKEPSVEPREAIVTVPEAVEKPAPKGFFSRLWAWIAGLFN